MRYRSTERDVLSGIEDEKEHLKNLRLPKLSSMKTQGISTKDSHNLSMIPLDALQSTANNISIMNLNKEIY